MPISSRANPQTHDVYFAAAGGFRVYWSNPNHSITVDDDGLTFTVDGTPRAIGWNDVAAVHLQLATLGRGQNIDQCKIEFTDGSAIVVSNAASSGLPAAAQTPIYRDFVRDLHTRLITQAAGAVRFTAGMPPWRYKFLLVTLVVAGLFFILTPLGLTLFTGDWYGLILAGAGAFFIWPFLTLLTKSAPRNYQPDALPNELLS